MKYVTIPKFTKAEMQTALANNDIERLTYVCLFVSLYYEDRDFAEEMCLKLANHSDNHVRGNAIEGFEHIARIDRKLNEELIKPIIEKATKDKDAFVRDKADWARDATEQFLKWNYKK